MEDQIWYEELQLKTCLNLYSVETLLTRMDRPLCLGIVSLTDICLICGQVIFSCLLMKLNIRCNTSDNIHEQLTFVVCF